MKTCSCVCFEGRKRVLLIRRAREPFLFLNPFFSRSILFPSQSLTPSFPPHHLNHREVDAPVKRANTALVRSVPKMYKQSLKELLAPYGFKGFKIAELTPNRTRRAQVCNWLLYYKRDLWGVSLDKLLEDKEAVTSVTREGETSEQLANKMVY